MPKLRPGRKLNHVKLDAMQPCGRKICIVKHETVFLHVLG